MGTLAYPASNHAFHDGGLARSISRTRSRRQSFSGLGYGGQQQIGIQFPHSDHGGGMYDEPPMSGGLYGDVNIRYYCYHECKLMSIIHPVSKTILSHLCITQLRSSAQSAHAR